MSEAKEKFDALMNLLHLSAYIESDYSASINKNDLMIIKTYVQELEEQNKWISVKDKLPEIDTTQPFYRHHTCVIACWGPSIHNIGEMEYTLDVVRGKEIKRFKWNGKLSPWNVLYWKPFPKPPENI